MKKEDASTGDDFHQIDRIFEQRFPTHHMGRKEERADGREDRQVGENARRLALICASAVLCGELSLMAALTNPGELMDAHRKLERS